MVAVISVDAYLFFVFLRPDLLPCGYGNRCFLVEPCCLTVRTQNLEVATKRLFHQQVKIQGSFSAIFAHGIASLQLFLVMWIFLRSLGVTRYLLWQMSSQWGLEKLLQGLVSHELTASHSIFKQLKLNELWHVNQIILNRITL